MRHASSRASRDERAAAVRRRAGKGTLQFHDCPDEDLEILQPREVLGAYYYPTGWDLPDYPGKIIHAYSETELEEK